jgi:hypothetical protein
MNTRSVHEYTVFAPVQLLRNWRDQQPSNKSDVDSRVKWISFVSRVGLRDCCLVAFK